jgi:hypothetical protein
MEHNQDNEVDAQQSTPSTQDAASGDAGFVVEKGLAVDVRSASGDLHITEGAPASCRVHLTTNDPDSTRRLALVECTYDVATNRIVVDTKAGQTPSVSGPSSIKKALSRWIDNVRHDVDIELELPAGASVRFRTASGDMRGRVGLSGLNVASASGDVSLGVVSGPLKFQSASGSLSVEGVAGPVEAKSASGDVRIGEVSGDLSVQTVSGDVSLTLSSPAKTKVNSVSGDVAVEVRRGLLLELDANTISGELSSEIALDGAQGSGGAESALQLKVRTISGDVKVRRA